MPYCSSVLLDAAKCRKLGWYSRHSFSTTQITIGKLQNTYMTAADTGLNTCSNASAIRPPRLNNATSHSERFEVVKSSRASKDARAIASRMPTGALASSHCAYQISFAG